MNLRKVIKEHPVLAIMRNLPINDIRNYAGTLLSGGIPFFEVALNSPDALKEIELLRSWYGDDVYIGAGTVLSISDARDAVDAGAQFVLSPSADERVLEYCAAHQITMMPGALTPSEVALCLRYGFDIVKLFPAGFILPGYVKCLKGPLDKADFVAIGGVTLTNARQLMSEGYLGVGLGSNLISKEYLQNQDWEHAGKEIRNFVRDLKS